MTQFPHVHDENTASDGISLGQLLGSLNGVTHGKHSTQCPAWRKSPKYMSHISETAFILMFFLGNFSFLGDEALWEEGAQRAL